MMPGSQAMIAGIDFGSKMAGTTAVCIGSIEGEVLDLVQSDKKKCADEFILKHTRRYPVSAIFLDAPLSLPGVYLSLNGCKDYFYRKADKELKAMSPMFLGGLTARAMSLKAELSLNGLMIYEAYPGGLARVAGLKDKGYKAEKDSIPVCFQILKGHLPGLKAPCPENWHQFDALLAYATGIRFYRREALVFGDEMEGKIWI